MHEHLTPPASILAARAMALRTRCQELVCNVAADLRRSFVVGRLQTKVRFPDDFSRSVADEALLRALDKSGLRDRVERYELHTYARGTTAIVTWRKA